MSQKGAPTMQSQYSTGQGSTYAPSVMSGSMAGRRSHTPPPRIRPFMIILMVMAVGLLFIGLIMTIIAVWPGYTPTGTNPLKIAGPILLGIGFLVLVIGIVNICYRDQDQKSKRKRQQQLLYAQSLSRTTLNSYQQPQTPTPSMDAKPGRSILKKSGSTSTYNGTANRESDSGMAGTNNSFSTNRSYESGDSMSGSGSADLGHVSVSMNPDPTATRQKGRSQQPFRKPAYSNQGYYGDGPDYDGHHPQRQQQQQQQQAAPRRQMQSHQTPSGYDMYDKQPPSTPSAPAINTGQGLITGHGLLSYTSPQPRAQTTEVHQQSSRSGGGGGGWGASRQGASNTAYTPDHSVSTVSQQYHAATTPSRQYQQQYTYQQRTPTPQQTPNNTSSTEV